MTSLLQSNLKICTYLAKVLVKAMSIIEFQYGGELNPVIVILFIKAIYTLNER